MTKRFQLTLSFFAATAFALAACNSGTTGGTGQDAIGGPGQDAAAKDTGSTPADGSTTNDDANANDDSGTSNGDAAPPTDAGTADGHAGDAITGQDATNGD